MIDAYIKNATWLINQRLGTNYTEKKVSFALEYPISKAGFLNRFYEDHARYLVWNETTATFCVYAKANSDRFSWYEVSEEAVIKLILNDLSKLHVEYEIVKAATELGFLDIDVKKYKSKVGAFVRNGKMIKSRFDLLSEIKSFMTLRKYLRERLK